MARTEARLAQACADQQALGVDPLDRVPGELELADDCGEK